MDKKLINFINANHIKNGNLREYLNSKFRKLKYFEPSWGDWTYHKGKLIATADTSTINEKHIGIPHFIINSKDEEGIINSTEYIKYTNVYFSISFSRLKSLFQNYKSLTLFPFVEDNCETALKKDGQLKFHNSENGIFKKCISFADFKKSLIELSLKFPEQVIDDIEQIIIDTETHFKSLMDKQDSSVDKILALLDSNNDGELDNLESSKDFKVLLTKFQEDIISVDKEFIQKFVRLSNFLNQKEENVINLHKSILTDKSSKVLSEETLILYDYINNYHSLLLHSINMVIAIKDKNLILFYEIYELFDKLNVFNSNYENEISNKLSNISSGIQELTNAIYQMEKSITNEIQKLQYITEKSFQNLQSSVISELKSIDSAVSFNNLMTTVIAYQTYKTNKNTKGLKK